MNINFVNLDLFASFVLPYFKNTMCVTKRILHFTSTHSRCESLQLMKEKLAAIENVITILDELRVKCPWDKKQTNETLRILTIEETYELSDAIVQGSPVQIKKELGDLLLHILFYAKIGEEEQNFTLTDVCNSLAEKLIYRHPHIFGDVEANTSAEVAHIWEKIKLKEKDGNKTILSGVPASLPSMIKAHRIQDKARSAGFDWEQKEDVWTKVQEEIAEFSHEIAALDKDKMENEFGDVFFSLINAARLYKINPDNALEKTNQKFIKRFTFLEQYAKDNGMELESMSLLEMEDIWQKAKRIENSL